MRIITLNVINKLKEKGLKPSLSPGKDFNEYSYAETITIHDKAQEYIAEIMGMSFIDDIDSFNELYEPQLLADNDESEPSYNRRIASYLTVGYFPVKRISDGVIEYITQNPFIHELDGFIGNTKIVAPINLIRSAMGDLTASGDVLSVLEDNEAMSGFLDGILRQAVVQEASDIYCESFPATMQIRLKIHGIKSSSIGQVPIMKHEKLIRVICSLAKNREYIRGGEGESFPITRLIEGINTSWRVSYRMCSYGNELSLRRLDKSGRIPELKALGYPDRVVELIESLTKERSGLCVFSGTMGSGKTTSSYSVLNLCVKNGMKVSTIEDPVENQLAGVNQASILDTGDEKSKQNVTYDGALRAMLRTGSDVFLVGECRDKGIAMSMVSAVLSGHLTFTTMHTENNKGVYDRLENWGIPRDKISDSMRAIISQRLIPRLCPHCKIEGDPLSDDSDRHYYIKNNEGCHAYGCNEGVSGEIVAAELSFFNSHARAMIDNGDCYEDVKTYLKSLDLYFSLDDSVDYLAIHGLIDPQTIEHSVFN